MENLFRIFLFPGLRQTIPAYLLFVKSAFYWAAGPLVNINDIAGSYSGIVFGITNTFGTMPGIICPFIVGIITKNVKFKI